MDLDALGLEVCPTRQEEPDDRSIGGTTIAAIVGVSPWRTPFDVWSQLTGKLPETREPTEQMTWGTRLEGSVLDAYRDLHNPSLERLFFSFRLKAKRHYRLSPDALASPLTVVDAKTSRWRDEKWGADGSDEIPPVYLMQQTWYCRFLRFSGWDIAALFGGSEFAIFSGPYDRDLGDWLEDEADRFWTKHVLADIPPDPMDGVTVDAYLKSRFPRAERKILDPAPPEIIERVRLNVRLDLAADWIERETEKNDNAIKLAIGSGAGFAGPGFKVRWSDVATNRTDWKAAFAALRDLTISHTKDEDLRRIIDGASTPSSYRRFTVHAEDEFKARAIPEGGRFPILLAPPASEEDEG